MVTTVARCAALGFASGGRTTSAVAAVTLRGSGPSWTKKLAVAAFAGELVGDKLPRTPSRLEIPPFAARVLAGVVVSRVVARRARADDTLPMLVGAVAAVAGTLAGARWRRMNAVAGRSDVPAALAEDAWVLGLVIAAAH
jgi:uncharacterized membrane protein